MKSSVAIASLHIRQKQNSLHPLVSGILHFLAIHTINVHAVYCKCMCVCVCVCVCVCGVQVMSAHRASGKTAAAARPLSTPSLKQISPIDVPPDTPAQVHRQSLTRETLHAMYSMPRPLLSLGRSCELTEFDHTHQLPNQSPRPSHLHSEAGCVQTPAHASRDEASTAVLQRWSEQAQHRCLFHPHHL